MEEMDKKWSCQEAIKKERIKESFNLVVKTKDQNLWPLKILSNLVDSKLIKLMQNNLMMLKIQLILGKICLLVTKI